MSPSDNPENRAFSRVDIEMRVEYAKPELLLSDYTRNLSKGGIFIRTPHPLPVGTQFLLRLQVPGEMKGDGLDFPTLSQHQKEGLEFALRCEVSWAKYAAADVPADEVGMGVRFLFASEKQRLEMDRFVEELVRRSADSPREV